MTGKFYKHLLSGIFFISLLSFSTVAVGQQTYTFGVIPQQKASVLKKNWGPLLAKITETTGVNLKFVPATDIPSFAENVKKSKYDFIYTNPYMYVQVSDNPGYKAFANATGKKIKGLFVVASDSPLQSREDLAGKTVSFPKGAFAADLLLRAGLKQVGVDIKSIYSRTHEDGYIGIVRGKNDAAGGVGRTFKSVNPKVKEKLRILWTSPGYTPHAFAAHKRVSGDTVEKVQKAMLAISADAGNLKLFQAMKLKQGVQAAQDSDWNDVRELAPFLKAVEGD